MAGFDLVFSHGAGSYLFDVAASVTLTSARASPCAVSATRNPAITEALVEQSKKLIHVSNCISPSRRAGWPAELVKRIGGGQNAFFPTAARRPTKACSSSRGSSVTPKAGLKF